MFADDLKIYKTITSNKDISLVLQDLDRIDNLCTNNSLKLNIEKCCHIHFTRKKQSQTVSYDGLVTTVTEIRDLDVSTDSKVNFKSHIEKKH